MTREAIFKQIGAVQLPDLLMEVDAQTRFGEALLSRRPTSSHELLAVYGALLAHGTDNDAKGVGSMIPGHRCGAHHDGYTRGGAERPAEARQRARLGLPERRADRCLEAPASRSRQFHLLGQVPVDRAHSSEMA